MSNSLDGINAPIILEGFVQEYSWGMDERSLVATLSGQTSSSGKYAELWFGDHPNGSAVRSTDGESIRLLLQTHAEQILGPIVSKRFNRSFPFLLKVLSVGSALSIQAHPDADLAKQLHQTSPDLYRDPFPKPEVGIALSVVEILYGFRPLDHLQSLLFSNSSAAPELCALLGEQTLQELQNIQSSETEFLQLLYSTIMHAPKDRVQRESTTLFQRLEIKNERSQEENWILELQSTYPEGDVGIFSFFLLNLVTVPPGAALYIGPNIPHAYLRNELVECMAPSDNVVRAGLTPKYIDTTTLISMLEYQSHTPSLLKALPTNIDQYFEYPVPLDDYFRIGVIHPSDEYIFFETDSKVEMLLLIEGEADIIIDETRTALNAGKACLVPATIAHYSLHVQSGLLFRVSVP